MKRREGDVKEGRDWSDVDTCQGSQGIQIVTETERGKEELYPRASRGSAALLTPCFWTSDLQNK